MRSSRPWKVFWRALLATAVTLVAAASAEAQVEISAREASVRIGGRLQTQFVHSSVGGGPGANFFFRRARLTADARLKGWLSGRVQYDFAGGGSLKDTYVRFDAGPALTVDFGHFKRAFDLFTLQSSSRISVIERDGRIPGLSGDRGCAGVGSACSLARLTDKLEFADRDLGLRLQGELGSRVTYQATLTNGAGFTDENDAKSSAGRLVFSLTDRVRLGANASVHDYVSGEGATEFAGAWGADLEVGSFETEGVHLQAGVVGGDNWRAPVAPGDPATFVGVQGIVSYFHPTDPGGGVTAVEPLARASWADPDSEAGGDGGLLLTPGFMVYFAERNKLGANVDVYSPQSGGTEWSLKIQSYFYF